MNYEAFDADWLDAERAFAQEQKQARAEEARAQIMAARFALLAGER